MSKILEAMLETVTGLYEAGAVDLPTKRQFEEFCLIPHKEKLRATFLGLLRSRMDLEGGRGEIDL